MFVALAPRFEVRFSAFFNSVGGSNTVYLLCIAFAIIILFFVEVVQLLLIEEILSVGTYIRIIDRYEMAAWCALMRSLTILSAYMLNNVHGRISL